MILIVILAFIFSISIAEEGKSGWGFGGVPAVAYDSDTGFLYGIVFEAYQFGDGSYYPDYLYTIQPTWTRTTKGSGENKIFFDSKYLLPKDIRVTAFLGYLTEQALPFYGFNGYGSNYNSAFEDQDDDLGKTRVYYRHERNTLRFTADFQRQFLSDKTRWIAGLGYIDTEIDSVDIDGLNEDNDDPLNNVPTLYEEYVDAGYIAADEALGGKTNYIKLGLVYDTRDNEPNPMSGIWTEALLTTVPEFLGSDFSYTMLTATHRQYFTLIERDLSFAYRLGYQGVISGDIPFYMLPWYQSSFKLQEGMGGSKSLRGILKNRVVGNSILMANLELRYKFLHTVIAGQNLYLALNAFTDLGQVLQPYEVEGTTLPEFNDESMHVSFGGGFRIALNENFIVAVDYGMAKDEQDGNSGLYIGLGYLY